MRRLKREAADVVAVPLLQDRPAVFERVGIDPGLDRQLAAEGLTGLVGHHDFVNDPVWVIDPLEAERLADETRREARAAYQRTVVAIGGVLSVPLGPIPGDGSVRRGGQQITRSSCSKRSSVVRRAAARRRLAAVTRVRRANTGRANPARVNQAH